MGKQPEKVRQEVAEQGGHLTGSTTLYASGWQLPPCIKDNSWNIVASYYCLLYVTEPSQTHPRTKLNAEKPQLLKGHLDQDRPETEPVIPLNRFLRWPEESSNPQTLQLCAVIFSSIFFSSITELSGERTSISVPAFN